MKPTQSIHSVEEEIFSGSGRLLEETDGRSAVRVVEFAGHFVPQDGLVIGPPAGGELTVWPDGRYAFSAPLTGEQGVATHYSYVLETPDGTSFVGSFCLGREGAVSEAMDDFQAWSLPELLDGAVGALLGGDAPELPEFFGPAVSEGAAHAESAGLAGLDPDLDDLTRLILDSHHV